MKLLVQRQFILGVVAASLFAGGCRTICGVDKLGRTKLGNPNQSVVQVVRVSDRYTVYPHSAPTYLGRPVVWVSTGAPINRIEWLTPLDTRRTEMRGWPPLGDLQCATTREICWVNIPERINYGYYPYYLYITVNGREVKI